MATKGVTTWLSTLVPDSAESYQKIIGAIDETMRAQKEREAAQILGVHYEDVFANEKMCGALRLEFLKIFRNGDEIGEIPKLEMPGALH